jgi:hypothetical protein
MVTSAVRSTSLYSISEVLASEQRSVHALQSLGANIKFFPHNGKQYTTVKPISDFLQLKTTSVIPQFIRGDHPAFLKLGFLTVTDKQEALRFVSTAKASHTLMGFFETHGVMHLYSPQSVLGLVISYKGKVGDRARKYFGLPEWSMGMKRRLAAIVADFSSTPTPSAPQEPVKMSSGGDILRLIRPNFAPQDKELTYLAYSDASVRPMAGSFGMTVYAVYFPDENAGVIKVLSGVYPVNVAEAQAAAMAISKFPRKVKAVLTDNQPNAETYKRISTEGFDWAADNSGFGFGAFKPFVDRDVTLEYIPREQNFVADYLSKYPAIGAKEGTFWFEVEVQGESVKLTPQSTKKTEPALSTPTSIKPDSSFEALLAAAIAKKDTEKAGLQQQINDLHKQLRPLSDRLQEIDSEVEKLRVAAEILNN